MHAYIPLATLLSFVAMGAARNFVVPLDVPAVCRANAFCVRTFVFSGTCNGQNRDDDGYVSCVCAIPDAQLALNSCATCAAQYGSDDDDGQCLSALLKITLFFLPLIPSVPIQHVFS